MTMVMLREYEIKREPHRFLGGFYNVTAVATEKSPRPALGFIPFVMSDDDASMETWIGYHCLILAYVDALNELRDFNELRRELRLLLDESGFHQISRLHKNPDLLGYDDEQFDATLSGLMEAGYVGIALLADRAREQQIERSHRHKPRQPTEAKRELIAKLERLSGSPNPHEAASAKARAEELKEKYEIVSSDPFDFDLDELYTPAKPTLTAELENAVRQAWTDLKKLGDRYYRLMEEPDQMLTHLQQRIARLERLMLEHPSRKRRYPIVEKRRP